MPKPFATTRERRLWGWLFVIVVGIYSTLGLASTLADELRDRRLLDCAFAAAAFILVVGVIIQGVRVRLAGRELGVLVMVVAVYFMVFIRTGIPEERSHLIEYTAVGLVAYEALLERRTYRPVPQTALGALAIAWVIGAVDEAIQLLIPSRVFDPIDIAFNAFAATMAVLASAVLKRARPGSDLRNQDSEVPQAPRVEERSDVGEV